MADWWDVETRVQDQAKEVRKAHNLAWNSAGKRRNGVAPEYIEDLQSLRSEALKLEALSRELFNACEETLVEERGIQPTTPEE